MYEDPEEDRPELPIDPATRAREKADEFRMHAELAAVFEGKRKFDFTISTHLDQGLAREVQRDMSRLEKARSVDSPVIPNPSAAMAAGVLKFFKAHDLSAGDYHAHRRPGEVMILRWLEGEQVETFYTRLQAHFDAAMEGFKEDERQALEWKKDPKTAAYLKALDETQVKMSERYLRDFIRQHRVFVLSTQTADEINIEYLCNTLMGIDAAELVGAPSAPPENPSERDLAWFFKLFALRGMSEGVERMCFFTFCQKTEETFDFGE